MNYELEELVPIVARLVEGYTSKASTSITYDRAQQLMRAVLYCIQEGENSGRFTLMTGTELSAEKMYEIGTGCVQEKTKETLNLYNGMMALFSSYGNRCLQDTVEKLQHKSVELESVIDHMINGLIAVDGQLRVVSVGTLATSVLFCAGCALA